MKRISIRTARFYAEKVKCSFKGFKLNATLNEDYIKLQIHNPKYSDRDIDVYFYPDKAILHFSYQHIHFDYNEDSFEDFVYWIEGFITGEYAAVEFFKNGKNNLGGHRKYNEIDLSSAESIASLFPFSSHDEQEIFFKMHPDYSEEEISTMFKNAQIKNVSVMFEEFKKNSYMVCVECWDKSKDKYAKIVWSGNGFLIMSAKRPLE